MSDETFVPRRVITAEDVLRCARGGAAQLAIGPDDRVTALARDTARDKGVAIVVSADAAPAWPAAGFLPQAAPRPGPASPGTASPGAAGSGAAAPGDRRAQTGGPSAPAAVRPGTAAAPAAQPAAAPAAQPAAGVPRLTHVKDPRRLALDPFPAEGPDAVMDVRLRDIVTARDGVSMGVGLMSLREGSFAWRLDYDEVEYVLEGELHITTAVEKVVGYPGDVIAVPRGSQITFGTPSWAKFLYVTCPADWSGA